LFSAWLRGKVSQNAASNGNPRTMPGKSADCSAVLCDAGGLTIELHYRRGDIADSARSHRLSIELDDRDHFGGSSSNEELAHRRKLISADWFLHNLDAGTRCRLDGYLARDARENQVAQRRSADSSILDSKKARMRAFQRDSVTNEDPDLRGSSR
jgi:hypothetical protein